MLKIALHKSSVSHSWLAIALIIIAALPYYGAWNFEFVNFDDPEYITNNQNVMSGLTWQSLRWALTANDAANWHPLTWVSHLLDVEYFGLEAGAHHLVNVVLHVVNTLLLFTFLTQASGCAVRSAVVAALFAAHPLHVESVAWIAERKDVLSTFFMLLTLHAYLAYTRRPTWLGYLSVFVLLALGLMTKPMLVTLPFLLLLLDAWPLNRIAVTPFDRIQACRLIKEKLPFFALVAVSSVITYLVQQEGGAVASVDKIPLMLRVSNALVSYVEYMARMFVPSGLAVLYPYPESIPVWKSLGAATVLTAVTVMAVRVRKNFTYVTVGWFWFVGTLIPVIGIVQVGSQAMADRYTYIPLVGLFILLVWGSYDLLGKKSSKRAPLAVITVSIVVALAVASWVQARYWINSESLWVHTLDVTRNNYRAHNKLGIIMADSGRQASAIKHYRAAIKINPEFSWGHNNLGNALASAGKLEESLEHFKTAISLSPDYASAYNGMGSVLDDLNRVDEAIELYRKALMINPGLSSAHNNLAAAFAKKGQIDQAIIEIDAALDIDSGNVTYQKNFLALVLKLDDIELARQYLEKALYVNPANEYARQALESLGVNKSDDGKTP